MRALTNAQGTAMPETALCEQDFREDHYLNQAIDAAAEPADGAGFVDVTENDEVACRVCGITGAVEHGIEKARAVLAETVPEDYEVTIVHWGLPAAGFRVAEVTFSKAGVPGVDSFTWAGASYMQSDGPEGLAVCAQVERVVITDAFMGDEQETEYEIERLRYLLRDPDEAPQDDAVVESPSGWSFRSSQENGDQVDCMGCGNALNDDLPIVNDDEGYAYHEGCLA
jgi:hypothetical protein